LTEFLSRIEGKSVEMEYVSGGGQGLLVISRRGGEENDDRLRIIRHYNVLDEEYFRYKWPGGAREYDKRDVMHKRGWTYFNITGRINGKEVRGRGRIPFVFSTSKTYWPWVVLKVGGSIVNRACFFGLSRPWMGLHTIDTVRRDAAQKRIWFETRYDKSNGKAQVVLKPKDMNIVYTIDMEKDVIDKVTFSTSDGRDGELTFSYIQEIGNIGSKFAEPVSKASIRERSEGMLWLLDLINDY
jgi:hypothetical protein